MLRGLLLVYSVMQFCVSREYRSFAPIVMSATSRAIAAPSRIAIPASASERAGESFTPSPNMMTLRPASCSRRM